MAKAFTTIIGITFVVFALIIGLTYGFGALGAAEKTVNVTDSPYAEQYNASVEASTVSFSLIGYIPLILGLLAVLVALIFLWRR
jgi:hypothetical protein